MEYLISADYGPFWLPNEITKQVINIRYGKVVELLNELYPCNYDKSKCRGETQVEDNVTYIRDVNEPNVFRFCVVNKFNSKEYYSVEIEDVDISRKWYIKEEDGAETIVYLDSFKCIDKDINLYG